jgi:hypothetical protein
LSSRGGHHYLALRGDNGLKSSCPILVVKEKEREATDAIAHGGWIQGGKRESDGEVVKAWAGERGVDVTSSHLS